MNFYMNKFRLLILVSALLTISTNNQLRAIGYEKFFQVSEFYSGREDLKTVGLGRSASTDDGRSGVVVNIFRKNDGSFVVQIQQNATRRNQRQESSSIEYIKAWRDKEDRIRFIWQGREYHTSPQIL